MYKVSELNPKDTTLDEIHKIQKEIYEETKKMIQEELLKYFHSATDEFCKKHKIILKLVSLEVSTK